MANIANSAGGVRDRCAEQREAGGRAGGSDEGGASVAPDVCVDRTHTNGQARYAAAARGRFDCGRLTIIALLV